MGTHLSVEELLSEFPVQEISRATALAGLPSVGSKMDRVYRLIDAGRQAGAGAPAILELFRTEALRRVCSLHGVRVATKREMILALTALLGPAGENLAFEHAVLVAPTVPAVIEYLTSLVLPWRLIRSEAAAEEAIARALRKCFLGVATQYSVGGYLGYRIDIALGDGQVGVEVKFAEAVIESSSETFRALGQAIVYKHRKFGGNLIVAITGPVQTLNTPAMAEVRTLLEAAGAAVAYVQLR